MLDQANATPDIHQLAQQFRQWRAHYRWKHYPKDLWAAACQLVAKHPLRQVARALGVQPYHLRTKMKSALCKSNEAPKFVEVLIPSIEQPSSVELRISRGADLEMVMKFDGSLQKAMPIIERLFCRGELT